MVPINFKPRPSQQKILEMVLKAKEPLRMGIAAVPGSGKTHILSVLASELVQQVEDEQEILIVTLVNAAVDNFRRRIDRFIREKGLLPGFNYRVCTLHSLAHEIVRQRPSLVGLTNEFVIIDERTTELILQEVVDLWLDANISLLSDYILSEANVQNLKRQELPTLVRAIAQNFIKRAKDLSLPPHTLEDAYRRWKGESFTLARLGIEIYREYQNRLARTGVDFDDLIRLAHQAIHLDPDFLARLREQWPYILEDEAQDSSTLQEKILDSLAGSQGNWIRVGDPNQAIYETFTTADPENLRRFLKQKNVVRMEMPESGRSSASIIKLANHLIKWTMTEHPLKEARDALQPPYIQPTPPNDPQPNPPDDPSLIHLYDKKFQPQKEITTIIRSVKRWVKENPDKSVAILDARNMRGFNIANALRKAGVPYVELLSSTVATRSTAGVLGNILKYLARPEDPKQLATVFRAWKRDDWEKEDLQPIFEEIEKAIRKAVQLEDYLWPQPGQDWIEQMESEEPIEFPTPDEEREDEPDFEEDIQITPFEVLLQTLREFRILIRRWQEAAILPIDQLILLLAHDLFHAPAELALSHKFAVVLRRMGTDNPSYRLPDFVEALAEIARHQRRFLGFDAAAVGFEPPIGKVTVSTMHRAKGLEWDRVYLLGVNNYSFPSGQPQDNYFSEKWFVQDSLNLEAETLAQLESLSQKANYIRGEATLQARTDLIRERLRLLFVGITRAKQELIITWNTGRQFAHKIDNQPAIPFIALQREKSETS